jgi:proteasome lid subunit RPN8/RPN11
VILKLLSQHLQTISTHAQTAYPEECCGIILGHLESNSKTVVELLPTENAWSPEALPDLPTENLEYSKKRRYAIAPEVMLQAQKQARERKLNIIGIYHSHPDNPAIPSEFDRLLAWQEYSYIIVSVQNGQAEDIKSWSLDDNHHFQEEEIEKLG